MKTCWECNNIRVKRIEDGHSIKCSLGKLSIVHRIKIDSMDKLETIYKNKMFLTASKCNDFDDEE